MAAQNPEPSVVAACDFDCEKDCETLRKAMEGKDTDKDTIIAILCDRDWNQLAEIKEMFQQMWGVTLEDEMKSELGGSLEDVVLNIIKSPMEQMAATLWKAVKGVCRDETAIIEIMCTSTNEELAAIKEIYKVAYGSGLMEDLVVDTSDDFASLLLGMSGGRDEEGPDLSDEDVKANAQTLYDASEGKVGTDKKVFSIVLANKGFHQLAQILDFYNCQLSPETGIKGAIELEFSGSIKEAYLAIVTTAVDGREAFLADQLYRSMKGKEKNDKQLTRLVTSRSQIDLKGCAEQFLQRHKIPLEDVIMDFTYDCNSDHYGKCLCLLVQGNNHQ